MVLTLESATYRYAGSARPALADVSLRVEPGEVVGVVGANESGKSTLGLVASGLAPATIGGHLEGTVRIEGLDTARARPHELAQRCGVLFQSPQTQLSGTTRTVWEEVAAGPRNLGLPLAEVVGRVERALATLGLEPLADRDPSRLSGGQAQLVALGAVLAMEPAYLVLDEPTSELDPHGSRLVADALGGLARRRHTGLLVIEHKTWLLAEIASRICVLARGRIVREGDSGEILTDAELVADGVEPPPETRLRAAARRRRVALPESVEQHFPDRPKPGRA